MVLYEAMAAGVVCVATHQGSIPEQLRSSPGILARSADTFVQETLPLLMKTRVSAAASDETRQAYLRALAESESQLTVLFELLSRPG